MNEVLKLREELERERMRLAACGVVALANTPDSAAKARVMHDDYRSASCDDVARAVDCQMALRAALKSVVAHWREFGPEHGMDECIEAAALVLGQNAIAQGREHSERPAGAEGYAAGGNGERK